MSSIREFNHKHQISIPEDVIIIPAIIISNRMFAGFEVDGINVINPFEFSNFIKKGDIVKLGEILKTRNTSNLPIEDVANFICSDTSYTKKALKSMEPNDITTILDSQQITFKSFKLPDGYFEKIKSFRFEKRMRKNDCSKLTMKLNINRSSCDNMKLERAWMNYATSWVRNGILTTG